MLELISVGNL